MKCKAVIFDMDGVLIDSEEIWKMKTGIFHKKYIPEFSEEDQLNLIGRSTTCAFDYLQAKYPNRFESLTQEDYKKAHEQYGTSNVYPSAGLYPHVRDCLEYLSKKYKVGLASSSIRPWIDLILSKYGIGDYFQVTVSGQDVVHSKPAPDIYLMACSKLGVDPRDCFAVEDSFNGIKAAKGAGMRVIGYKNGLNDDLTLEHVDCLLYDYSKISEII